MERGDFVFSAIGDPARGYACSADEISGETLTDDRKRLCCGIEIKAQVSGLATSRAGCLHLGEREALRLDGAYGN
jgi:hypothetical protein